MTDAEKIAAKKAAAVARVRAWRLANPEKAKALRAKENEKARERGRTPEQKARAAERMRARRAADPQKFREAERAHRAKNVEKIRAQEKARREANLEKARERRRESYRRNKAKRNERQKAYYQENRERIRQAAKAYQDRCSGEDSARVARWRAANPEAARAQRSRRKGRIRNAPGRHTAEDIKRIMAAQRQKCAGCRVSLRGGYHVDHIVPVALGGSNEPRNLQLLCAPCNIKKSAKPPLEWAREMGRLV